MAHVLAELKIVPKQESGEAASLAKELGLELQAKRYEKPLATDAFKPLSADETTLWAFHCPTRYVPGGGDGVRALEQYAFDSVPVEVMRHWKSIKDNYNFDRFEVWTTERTPRATDPLLIGVIGATNYLLARWGLESPEQLPLQQIAEEQYRRGMESATKDAKHYSFWPFDPYASALERMIRWERNTNRQFAAAERLLGKI